MGPEYSYVLKYNSNSLPRERKRVNYRNYSFSLLSVCFNYRVEEEIRYFNTLRLSSNNKSYVSLLSPINGKYQSFNFDDVTVIVSV